jgi:hypothetical protein
MIYGEATAHGRKSERAGWGLVLVVAFPRRIKLHHFGGAGLVLVALHVPGDALGKRRDVLGRLLLRLRRLSVNPLDD